MNGLITAMIMNCNDIEKKKVVKHWRKVSKTSILLQIVRIIFILSELFFNRLYEGYKCFLTVQLTANFTIY